MSTQESLRPYGKAITLAVPQFESPDPKKWPKFVDLIAIIDARPFEIGIRNIKTARFVDLLVEAHLTSLSHYPTRIVRHVVQDKDGKTYPVSADNSAGHLYARCMWTKHTDSAKEIEFEIINPVGASGTVEVRVSQFATLHSALQSAFCPRTATRQIIIPSLELTQEIGAMMPIYSRESVQKTA